MFQSFVWPSIVGILSAGKLKNLEDVVRAVERAGLGTIQKNAAAHESHYDNTERNLVHTQIAPCFAQQSQFWNAEPALTIYNQNFAVVRDTVPLDLKSGVNEVRFADATAHVEPDSVILRDPAGKHSLQILEQNYRNDPVSQELLLSLFEGKTIDFENMRMKDNTQVREIIPGKIVRSGYVPGGGAEQPIIEVNGKLQFSLPGQPLFPEPRRRHDSQADAQLAAAIRQARQVRRRSRLRHRRFQLERELQSRRAGKGRHGGFDRLDHDEQPKRQNVSRTPKSN